MDKIVDSILVLERLNRMLYLKWNFYRMYFTDERVVVEKVRSKKSGKNVHSIIETTYDQMVKEGPPKEYVQSLNPDSILGDSEDNFEVPYSDLDYMMIRLTNDQSFYSNFYSIRMERDSERFAHHYMAMNSPEVNRNLNDVKFLLKDILGEKLQVYDL